MILRRKFRRGVAELHKPKGGAKGLKFGKWFALLNRHLPPVVKSKKWPNVEKCCPSKRKQKAKCYFAFCAFISKSYQMPFSIQNVVALGYPRQLPQPLTRMRLPMRSRQQIIPLRLVFILRGAGAVRIKIPHH